MADSGGQRWTETAPSAELEVSSFRPEREPHDGSSDHDEDGDAESCASAKDPQAVLARAKEVLDAGCGRKEHSEATIREIQKTLASVQDFDSRWESYKSRFDQVLRDSLVAMAGALGLSNQQRPAVTEEAKRAVFGGETPSVDNLCRRVAEGMFRRVVVLAGAGISVAAGIPDYRSPGSGIYELVKERFPGLPSAESLFHIDYFKEDARPYYTLTKERFLGNLKPTRAHQFIRLLALKKILLRCYTQNVDGLEQMCGVPSGFVVEAHGSIRTAACLKCGKDADMEKFRSTVQAGEVPTCPVLDCGGLIKPGIVFYGEPLPTEFHHMSASDMSACDLLIIMGTSLRVAPFSMLPSQVPGTTPRLLLNMEMVGGFLCDSPENYRDVAVLGDVQQSVQQLVAKFGWGEEFEKLCKGIPNVATTEVGKTTALQSPESSQNTTAASASPGCKSTMTSSSSATSTSTVTAKRPQKNASTGKARPAVGKKVKSSTSSVSSTGMTASPKTATAAKSPSREKTVVNKSCMSEHHVSKRT